MYGKTNKRMPTMKQKAALKYLVANGRSVSKTMRAVGYSPETAKVPGKLTKSVGWKQLLAEISDESILDKLRQIAMSPEDKRACLQAIDMLLKLKNKYPASKLQLGPIDDAIKELEV